jgi:hypothetical protein
VDNSSTTAHAIDFKCRLKTILLSIAWAIVLLVAIRQYRWRGLWLFTGAPLALWLPYTMYLIAQARSQNRHACP